MKALGMDTSSGDGVIDWQLACTHGIRFATIRASWGLDGVDANYATNMTHAYQAHIYRSPYHWFVPRKDAVAQARWFVNHSSMGELPHMVDLEDNPKTGVYGYHGIWTEIKKFLDQVQAMILERCWIYLSPSYVSNYLYDCPWLNEYPIVIAHWQAAAPKFTQPLETGRWIAWQFTGNAPAPYYGITQCREAALYIYNGELPALVEAHG